MLIFDHQYAGSALQTKVPCDFHGWICSKRKYKQSSEEGNVFSKLRNQISNPPSFSSNLKSNLYMPFHMITILIILLSVLQFSANFAILLFHYDGRVTEWDEFEWSKHAIHISVSKQTKWCASIVLTILSIVSV